MPTITCIFVCPWCGWELAIPARCDEVECCVEFACLMCGKVHTRKVNLPGWYLIFPADFRA